MRFRRRRGLESFQWPWSRGRPESRRSGEDASRGTDGKSGSGGSPVGARGERANRRTGSWWRRRSLASALLLVLLFGLGYLAASRWLFPGGQQAEAGEVVQVPDLVGLATGEADRSVTRAGLTIEVAARVPHPKAPAGAVVAQTPLPGQYARPGAPVQVTLSSGPEKRRVPDLRGLSDRQGEILLERLGFRTSLDSTASTAGRGQVVGTRPDSGSVLELPAEVTLLVSRGPRTAAVPDLSGRHVEDVPTILRDAGLSVGEITYDSDAFQASGRVIAQSPPPGYALRRGGPVSIRVAGPAPPAGMPDSAGPADDSTAPPVDSARAVADSGRDVARAGRRSSER